MFLPAGKHDVEFRFEPSSFTTGRMISIIASLLVFLIILMTIFIKIKNRNVTDKTLVEPVNTPV
jgi:uncharacterized membrane protein YfhO